MESSISRLHALVAPPRDPFYSSGDWTSVERELGVTLPDDYKQLITSYGQGMFQGRRKYSGLSLTSFLRPISSAIQAEATSAALRALELKYPVYPHIPGLLGLGVYKDVDFLTCLVASPSNQSRLVYQDVETGSNELFDVGLIDLIISILNGTSPLHDKGIIMPEEMEGPHTFIPED